MSRIADVLARFEECKALCDNPRPATYEEVAEYRTLTARQRARDEARQAGPTPQASLPLDEAA